MASNIVGVTPRPPPSVPIDFRPQLGNLLQLLVAQGLDSIELGKPTFEVGGELALVTPAMLAVAVGGLDLEGKFA